MGKISRQELNPNVQGELDKIGILTNLTTTDKTSLVAGINEVNSHTSDAVKHVTQADKDNWNGKANLGTFNTDINKIKALTLNTDTRSTALTYTSGNLTKVEDKDGTTILKTTNLSYDANSNLTTVEEIAGGTTVTTTMNYDVNGNLISTSKAVM
jgi:YD repeat-containing protein